MKHWTLRQKASADQKTSDARILILEKSCGELSSQARSMLNLSRLVTWEAEGF